MNKICSFTGLYFPDPCSFHSFQRYILHHTDCHWEVGPQCQIAALHSASSWRDSGWQLQDTQWYMLQKQGANLCFLIKGYIGVCWKMVRKLSHQEPWTGNGIWEWKRCRYVWDHERPSLELAPVVQAQAKLPTMEREGCLGGVMWIFTSWSRRAI